MLIKVKVFPQAGKEEYLKNQKIVLKFGLKKNRLKDKPIEQ